MDYNRVFKHDIILNVNQSLLGTTTLCSKYLTVASLTY